MYIRTKCVILQRGVEPKILESYGFRKVEESGNWTRDVNELDILDGWITYYNDTKRFVYKYPKMTSYRHIKKYIKDLIKDGIIRTKVMYEYLVLIGSFHNFSYEKREKIVNKIERKQRKYDDRHPENI